MSVLAIHSVLNKYCTISFTLKFSHENIQEKTSMDLVLEGQVKSLTAADLIRTGPHLVRVTSWAVSLI